MAQLPFVSEAFIDDTLAECSEQDQHYLVEALQAEQPHLLAYLVSDDNFSLFLPEEREALVAYALVVWRCVGKAAGGTLPQLSGDDIAEAEEANWAYLQRQGGKSFSAKLDECFEGHPQEDLLAFVEDVTELLDEQVAGGSSKEHFFASLKTVLDACLLAAGRR